MSNLTIVVDEATLKKARLKALNEGRSVNEVLRNFLESYAGVAVEQVAALDDLLALSRGRNRDTLAINAGRARSFTIEADAPVL